MKRLLLILPALLAAAISLSAKDLVDSAAAQTSGAPQPRPGADEPITFDRDVAPIVFAHCAVCHRPGEIGPFSLLAYRDARLHAQQIADLTARRVMPPWKPKHGEVAFIGDRSLSNEQIDIIRRWVEQGAQEGNAADLPPAPTFAGGWQLGTPDLVVSMKTPYVLQASGGDVFRTFVIPIPTDAPRYVRGLELHPGNARAVHHVNIGVDRTGSSRRLDALDPEPGYVGGMVPDADYPPGYMLGWTPGQRARPSPDGMPWRLEPGSDLVVQMHMQTTGKPEDIQVSAGLYFTDEPPVRTPIGLRLGSETIDIAPGDAHYVVDDGYVLPADVELLAVQPHAHNLGRRMHAEAALPDGRVVPLITIDDWDFRWQDVYRYEQPIALPRGTRISMEYTYDNSRANPRNASNPPRRVVWGQNTTDEMGDLWLQVVAANASDLPRLVDDISRKTRGEDLAAYTKLLNEDPDNPLRHDTVGMLSLQAGDAAAAARQFRASLALNPDSAPTHYNLGIALSAQRLYDNAIAEFREALRVNPDYADAHNNLAALLMLNGAFDEAATHLRRAIQLRGDNADAHNNLARILWAEGQSGDAVAEFKRALALRPDMASPMAGLAWVRATAADAALRNPAEAISLGERAADLTGRRDPAVLDILAAAYAAAGQFERAASAAQTALDLAAASPGSAALADQIRGRLALYTQRKAFLSPYIQGGGSRPGPG